MPKCSAIVLGQLQMFVFFIVQECTIIYNMRVDDCRCCLLESFDASAYV